MYRDPEPLRNNEILELVACHRRQPDADPPRWNEALATLARDECLRDAALEVDPLLLFQNLPEVEMAGDEVAAMKRRVHELRRSREIESRIEPAGRAGSRRERTPRRNERALSGWRLAAILSVLLLGASFFLRTPPSVDAPPSTAETARLAADARSFAESEAAHDLPLVESLDGGAELIQIEDAEMSIVVASLPSDFEI